MNLVSTNTIVLVFTSHPLHTALVACWCLLTYGMSSLATLRAASLFVLMHSDIVNGYQLLLDAHAVLEPHRGTDLYFYFTHCRPFPLFLFMCLSL